MALKVKSVVDRGMHAEEALGRSSRFEPLHLDRAIKEYLTSLDSDALSESDHRRALEIIVFTTNLEHAGDIVEKNLMALAAKRIRVGMAFSPKRARPKSGT
jgi:Na+/phosphate symporter